MTQPSTQTNPPAPDSSQPRLSRFDKDHPHYRWIALTNTTLGVLMATINSSIVIISLPAIFRGIKLNPLDPGNVSYLLWILMGFLVVSAVLVVTLGRLGDIYGRVKIYNLGFLVFSVFSVLLSVDPFTGGNGAIWLIAMRVGQGVGGAMLFANSTAILADAFPASQRGMAMGINQVAAIAGSFLGLLIGGLLSEWDWRAVFWVSVPIGIVGTLWGYKSLVELGARRKAKLDVPGNVTFALGLTAILVAITYGIQPYGDHATGWLNPWVLGGLIGGALVLVAFVIIEQRVESPMVTISLFRIRAFTMGNIAGLMASVGRGGLQFMLIIWLQGIWLPLHGYKYVDTPLWAGIFMLPLTIGFLLAGPVSGWLSDHLGARRFATGGSLLVAATFIGLLVIPVNFPYWLFALVIFLNGLGSGFFSAPNTTVVMNAVPAHERGAASGVRGTVFNSGGSLSIGVFFSLMVVGLATVLPRTLTHGLTAQHVPHDVAAKIGNMPPVGSLFASFLGYNPIGSILGPTGVLKHLPAKNASTLTGKEFFPNLMSGPFHHGLIVVFVAAAAMMVIAAIASWAAGGKYVHDEVAAEGGSAPAPAATAPSPQPTAVPAGAALGVTASTASRRPEPARAAPARSTAHTADERTLEQLHHADAVPAERVQRTDISLDPTWSVARRFECGHIQHACCRKHLDHDCPICVPRSEHTV